MKNFQRAVSLLLTVLNFSLLSLLIPTVPAWAEEEEKREIEKEMVEGDWLYHVLEFDAIPPVDDPVFATRKEAEAFMTNDEPVLGLVIGSLMGLALFLHPVILGETLIAWTYWIPIAATSPVSFPTSGSTWS